MLIKIQYSVCVGGGPLPCPSPPGSDSPSPGPVCLLHISRGQFSSWDLNWNDVEHENEGWELGRMGLDRPLR